MTENEVSRFRITVWPERLEAPSQVAVPRVVGLVGPSPLPPVPPELGLVECHVMTSDCCQARRWQPEPEIQCMLAPDLAERLDDARGAQLLEWLRGEEHHIHLFSRMPQRRADYLLFDTERTDMKQLPDEMFLRELLAVDGTDPVQVAVATMTWGPLVAPSDELLTCDIEPFSVIRPPSTAPYVSRSYSYAAGEEPRLESEVTYATHWDMVQGTCFVPRQFWIGVPDNPDDDSTDQTGLALAPLPLWRYCEQFRVFQALMESWALRQADEGLLDSGQHRLARPWSDRGLPVPASELDALDTLARSLNGALAGLGPHVSLEGPEIWWRPVPRLAAALFLQVLAFVSDGLPTRRCANEACLQWFTRQRGRSRYGQRRTVGVMYCSSACAKAQTQREYRRRKRAQG